MQPNRIRSSARSCTIVLSFSALLSGLVGQRAEADAVCALWPDGTICKPLNVCLDSGSCQGGNCVADPLPVGTECLASADPCKDDSTCDGMGNCIAGALLPADTVCQDSPNPCLGNKVCNATGQCVAGSMLPAGTICRISLNNCVGDSVCDPMGQCVAGAPRAMGTVCLDSTSCRASGTCNGSGVCAAGAAVNEGRPCASANFCENTSCRAGACQSAGPRDCSMGDPCRKRDACMPDVGCLAVNICDMMSPPDMTLAPDLMDVDLMGVDLTGVSEDLGMNETDQAGTSQDLGPPDMAAPADGPARGDLGPRSDSDAGAYRIPVRLVGGACQCNLGGGDSPPPVGLLILGLWLWRRRSVMPRR